MKNQEKGKKSPNYRLAAIKKTADLKYLKPIMRTFGKLWN